MKLTLLLYFLYTAFVYADVECLVWDVIVPDSGVYCHLTQINEGEVISVENVAVTAQERAVALMKQEASTLKDAATWKWETYRFKMAWDAALATKQKGLQPAANQPDTTSAEEGGVDIVDMTGLTNKGYHSVTLLGFQDWLSLAWCMIGTSAESTDETIPTSRKRAPPIVQAAAVRGAAVLAECYNDDFKGVARPFILNITDSQHNSSAKLADVASLLQPIAQNAQGAQLAEGAFDLALPGSEEATRVTKAGVANAAEHLNEEEMLSAREQLKDPGWSADNCQACQGPTKAKRNRMNRRGQSLSVLCCKPMPLPAGIHPQDTPGFDEPSYPNGKAPWALDQANIPYHLPRQGFYREGIPETAVSKGAQVPPFTTHAEPVKDRARILADLDTRTTAVLEWAPDAIQRYSSKDLFPFLRKVFEPSSPEEHTISAFLGTRARPNEGPVRFETQSRNWLTKPTQDRDLMRLQAWTVATCKQAIEIAVKLKGWSADQLQRLEADIDFYYVPRDIAAEKNPDPRGLHVDDNIMQFIAADQPGLIVSEGNDLWRVPLANNAWYIIKGAYWDPAKYYRDTTLHTVFGPEMGQFGRVSIIVNVAGIVGLTPSRGAYTIHNVPRPEVFTFDAMQ